VEELVRKYRLEREEAVVKRQGELLKCIVKHMNR
jgi:hypothetical protein